MHGRYGWSTGVVVGCSIPLSVNGDSIDVSMAGSGLQMTTQQCSGNSDLLEPGEIPAAEIKQEKRIYDTTSSPYVKDRLFPNRHGVSEMHGNK